MSTAKVYILGSLFEHDRPIVNYEYPPNARQNWGIINYVLDGVETYEDRIPLEVFIPELNALEWDFYGLAGAFGVYSERAAKLLMPYASLHFNFQLLPVNGAPYYFINRGKPLDCLNLAESVVVRFRPSPHRIKDITKYSFHKDVIDDPLVWHIPEMENKIFCSDSIPKLWAEAGLRGLRFDDAEPPGGYRHPAYQQ